jgi:hypothetical protein
MAHGPHAKGNFLAWNKTLWLRSGPWDACKFAMWCADKNSCPPLFFTGYY